MLAQSVVSRICIIIHLQAYVDSPAFPDFHFGRHPVAVATWPNNPRLLSVNLNIRTLVLRNKVNGVLSPPW